MSFYKRITNPLPSKLAQTVIPKPPSRGLSASREPQFSTDIYTYFTKAGEQTLVYSAKQWVRIKLTLETAGPVAFSTRADITPTLSGKGVLLATGVQQEITLPSGDRLYFLAESINRVKVIIEPVPWLEQIFLRVTDILNRI